MQNVDGMHVPVPKLGELKSTKGRVFAVNAAIGSADYLDLIW